MLLYVAELIVSCLVFCGLALAQTNAGEHASAPDASELAADAALFRLGSDTTLRKQDKPAGRFLYDLELHLAGTATGREPETQLDYDLTEGPLGVTRVNWHTAELLHPRPRQVYPSAMLSAGAEWEVSRFVLLRGLLDSGELRDGATLDPPTDGVALSGAQVGETLSSLMFVRELSVTLGPPALQVELGRFRATVADGLVYDDFGTGARARLDLGALGLPELRSELFVSTIGQRFDDVVHDPIVGVRVEYSLSFFDSIGLFAAGVRDSDGVLTQVMRSAVAERTLDHPALLSALLSSAEGEGELGYVGVDTALSLGAATFLQATGVLSGGHFALDAVELRDPSQTREIACDVLAGAGSVELRHGLGNAFELAGYAFALSGDRPPRNGHTYYGFIGAAPYWVWTGLFFSGGLNQSLFANRSAAAGVHGHGVIGAGPSLAWRAHGVDAELRAIWLEALANPPAAPIGGTGRSYGLESDVRVQWKVLRWLALGAELDLLFAGNFFAERAVGYRALSVASLRYAN